MNDLRPGAEPAAAAPGGDVPVAGERSRQRRLRRLALVVVGLRRGGDRFGWEDIEEEKMTEEIAPARAIECSEAERRLVATHEAGHATVAWLVGKGRKLEVLSIIGRRSTPDLLAQTELEAHFTRTRTELEVMLEIALGGMVAEQLVFGETSSAAATDLRRATTTACEMIGGLGMGDSLISSYAVDGPGLGNLVARVLATPDGRREVEEMLRATQRRVTMMLGEHLEIVEALRDALLAHEELIGEEITAVIEHALSADAHT